MNSLTEDLWMLILARLPLKNMTSSKLICKQWKSIVESPFLSELLLSIHRNSHSSWSLMSGESQRPVISYYGCKVWGLPRPLGSHISSFLTENFKTQEKIRVVACTDIGLILLSLESFNGNLTYYVANPISRQCVNIPPPPSRCKPSNPVGLDTRTENGLVLGYKIVVIENYYNIKTSELTLLIYSSETGLWSLDTLHTPHPLRRFSKLNPISLNGNLYWLGDNLDKKRVIIYHNLYSTSPCRVIPLPDTEYECERRCCTTSQGSLIYMNIIVSEMERTLRVWRLKCGEWELISGTCPAGCSKIGFECFPLVINPFDSNVIYLWSKIRKCLAITNLHKGRFGIHDNLERSNDGRTLSFVRRWESTGDATFFFSTFVLPLWLYRIPSPTVMTYEQGEVVG